jgi:hypothetical protein
MHLNKGYPGRKTLFGRNSETFDFAFTFTIKLPKNGDSKGKVFIMFHGYGF